MGMERGGFGNVARSASFVERVCLTAVCARDCWAGAAAAAAGCGLPGSTDLLASALRTSVAMAGLFSMKLLKKIHHLQLENAGKFWSFWLMSGSGRVGCACCCATMWTLRCLEAGGFVGSVRVREQHVRVRSVRDWAVCAHVVLWAAALCACALFAWVACMWAVLMGMRGTGA